MLPCPGCCASGPGISRDLKASTTYRVVFFDAAHKHDQLAQQQLALRDQLFGNVGAAQRVLLLDKGAQQLVRVRLAPLVTQCVNGMRPCLERLEICRQLASHLVVSRAQLALVLLQRRLRT